MITPMQMYWLLKLDDIHKVSGFVFVMGLVLLLFCGLGVLFFSDENTSAIYKHLSNIVKWIGFPLTLLGGSVNVFVPTTKQMATMFVVPAIVNNEKVQTMANRTLDVGVNLLELTNQQLEEMLRK